MTIAINRWLLPLVFALLSLMLSMHQAAAAVRSDEHCARAVVLGEVGHDSPGLLHSTTCCTSASGVVAPDGTTAFVKAGGLRFALDAGWKDAYRNPGSKHFRPPRPL